MLSIQAVKGVEIGLGFEAARRTGAEVHDEIEPAPGRTRAGHVRRRTNRAGGLEGGMTTGEPLVIRVAMKPIATLMRPLDTVDVATGATAVGGGRTQRRHRGAGDGRDRRGDGGVRVRAGRCWRSSAAIRCARCSATWRGYLGRLDARAGGPPA